MDRGKKEDRKQCNSKTEPEENTSKAGICAPVLAERSV